MKRKRRKQPTKHANSEAEIDLIFELGTFKNVLRSWCQMLGPDVDNDAEHTCRVGQIAMIIGTGELCAGNHVDIGRVSVIAQVHDWPELRTGDGNPITRRYVKQDEERALRDILANTGMEYYLDPWLEYKRRNTLEAQIVKDADNLAVEVELIELEAKGNRNARKIRQKRVNGRDELFTESARRMYDGLQKADPSAWHMRIREQIRKEKVAERKASKKDARAHKA